MSEISRRHLALAPGVEAAQPGTPVATPALGHSVLDRALAAGVGTVDALSEGTELDDSVLLQVGDLAKASGKTVRALHLYEELGLIEPARRSRGRYRLFSPDTKVRIRWISKLQSLGLSLTEIQAIALRRHSSESARRASQELCEVYAQKLAEVRDTIREYRALEAELEASVAFLEGCQHECGGHVATSGCSACTRHVEPVSLAPDLVLGAQI
jgi:MerR family transcriptional regulator, copper efflux regulator